MRFALFFLAEYAGMITTSALCVALFFGGWHIPWLDQIPALSRWPGPDYGNNSVTTSLFVCILRAIVFFLKALAVLFTFMWVRWSLPRFRFDQLMDIAWRGLIPISLALLMGTAMIVYWRGGRTYWSVDGGTALMLLCLNILVVLVAMAVSLILPAPPNTNRRIRVRGSRFSNGQAVPSVAVP
jgi:NADH-quinone oxidoreductase subunit H